ncbi:MAG: hypothetical protein CSB47_00395 [Proteobacteria bacterium]|nr:MAG: hypothetical protein CSB47_00395 [Pseudomonadota bacterium]
MHYSGSDKRRIINILLLLVVCVLAWLIVQKVQKEQRGPDTLYSDAIGKVMTRISIQLPHQPVIMMQAQGASWQMTAPLSAKVNTQALQQLTTLLYEPIQAKYPVEGKDLSAFGLGESAIRVQFNDVEYALGALNPVNHYRYVLHNQQILMVNEVVYELLSRGVVGFVEEG